MCMCMIYTSWVNLTHVKLLLLHPSSFNEKPPTHFLLSAIGEPSNTASLCTRLTFPYFMASWLHWLWLYTWIMIIYQVLWHRHNTVSGFGAELFFSLCLFSHPMLGPCHTIISRFCNAAGPCVQHFLNEHITINSVTRNTSIHAFHITGICPWTYIPATLNINVSLHCSFPMHQ